MPPPCRNLLVCPPAELPNGSSSSSTDSSNIVKKKREKKVKKKQKRKGGQNLRWSTLQAKVDKTCAGLRFKRYLQQLAAEWGCKVKGETVGTPYGVLGSKAKNA